MTLETSYSATIIAEDSGDNIIAGRGSDLIIGGVGNDVIMTDAQDGGNDRNDQDVISLGDVSTTVTGNDVITDFDTNNFRGGENNFDTLTFTFDGADYSLSTGLDIVWFVRTIERDGDIDTDAIRDGDDIIFVFARDENGVITNSVRLEGIIGDDGVTNRRLDNASIDELTSADVFAEPVVDPIDTSNSILVDDAFAAQIGVSSISADVTANDTIDEGTAVTLVETVESGSLELNSDGTFTFDAGDDFDALAQGETQTVTFTYQVPNVGGEGLTLIGGSGSDVLTGGSGNDTITTDDLDGSNGVYDRDTVILGDVLNPSSGNDTITDFDTNNFRGGENSFDTLTFTFDGADYSLSTGLDIVQFVHAIERDGDLDTDAIRDGDDIIFVFARDENGVITNSVSLEGIIGDDGVTNRRLDNASIDELTSADVFAEPVVDQGGTGTVTATVSLTVTGINDAPTVESALNVVTTEGFAPASVDLLQGASDVDNGAVLSIANESELPSGVTLDGTVLTVDPADPAFDSLALGELLNLVVTYDVIDENGASVAQTVNITVTGTNDTPESTQAIATQQLLFGAPYTLTLSDQFTDIDGDSLSLSATLSNGDPLPSWLSFDAETGTFSGTPEPLDAGVFEAVVTAVDGNGGEASEIISFEIGEGLIFGTDGDDAFEFGFSDGALVLIPIGADLTGTEGNDTILAGAGDDEVNSEGGDDVLLGEFGDDELNAGAGDDVLIGGTGNDRLDGGDGNDTYIFREGDGNDFISDSSSELNTTDVIQFVDYNLADATFFSIPQTSTYIVSFENGDTLTVALAGNLAPFTFIESLEFADQTVSRAEVFELIADNTATNGDDTIVGSNNSDNILGGLGDDVIQGGMGNDRLDGGAGNDEINGGTGRDFITGEDGEDTLIGGLGDDILNGGVGADTFVFNEAVGLDRIQDFEDGIDTIDLSDFSLANDFDSVLAAASQVDGNVRLEFDSANVVILEGFDIANLDATDFIF